MLKRTHNERLRHGMNLIRGLFLTITMSVYGNNDQCDNIVLRIKGGRTEERNSFDLILGWNEAQHVNKSI